jgi:hypothetical protein
LFFRVFVLRFIVVIVIPLRKIVELDSVEPQKLSANHDSGDAVLAVSFEVLRERLYLLTCFHVRIGEFLPAASCAAGEGTEICEIVWVRGDRDR